MSHHIINIEEIHYSYPNGEKALDGISCKIQHGEAVAIIGANGSGKTTLLRHLNGILLAQQGKIYIGDTPIIKSTLPTIRSTVGMVFQNPDDQLFMPTVFDDVAFALINLGYPQEEVIIRVKNVLTQFDCWQLKDRPPFTLSGGEQRKISIAVVLAMSPDILLMDEPTANLDSFSRRECINLIKNFTHTRIIVSHDLDLVVDICQRVIIMQQGKIVADDTPQKLFADEELLKKYRLEPPLRMQK